MPVVRRRVVCAGRRGARCRRVGRRRAGRAGIVALVIAVPAGQLVLAGCGAGRETTGVLTAGTQRGDRAMERGLVTPGELPGGFHPATDRDLFRGFRPAEPACRELFAHADHAGGPRGVPQAHTVLYQIEPGGSLEERVIMLSPAAAVRRLRLLRGLGRRCRGFAFPAITGRLDMRRARPPVPRRADDSYAVRYRGRVNRDMSVHLDWFAARVAGGLLVLARSSLAGGPAAGTTSRIAAAAVTRLRRLVSGVPPVPGADLRPRP